MLPLGKVLIHTILVLTHQNSMTHTPVYLFKFLLFSASAALKLNATEKLQGRDLKLVISVCCIIL